MARIPTGIPAKKTQRQPKLDTINPPMIGPEIAPVPMIVMYSPIALPRSFEGNTSVISAMLLAWTPADAIPWSILAAIRKARLWDRPPTKARMTNPA